MPKVNALALGNLYKNRSKRCFNPIYLIILAKHYLIKYGIEFGLTVNMTGVSTIGSVLIINKDYLLGKGDFKNGIVFVWSLLIVSVILLIGTIILYFKYKNKGSEKL